MATEFLRWDPGITLGVEEIDLEHQTFVVLINRLEEVKGDASLAPRATQALIKYAAFHFQSEENTFFEAGFPELERHRVLHLDLLEQLNVVLHELKGGQVDYDVILAFFKSWFIEHTSEEDKRFAAFLRCGEAMEGVPGACPPPPLSEPVGGPTDLSRMPKALLECLNIASLRCDTTEVAEIAKAVRGFDPSLADWLALAGQEFHFAAIAQASSQALLAAEEKSRKGEEE